ncbi:hypothetical protein [Murimonas intestini]|uniref:hypothetical protein n=1 Tax=Murimonas intestini TaxID=1337051 RepID=UPI00248B7075|nr:hypothetical protein [Murimonas intestini]
MIKNKELLDLVRQKKDEISCDNCKQCNLNAFHMGKWYCSKHSVLDCPVDVTKCFESKN